MNLRDELLKIEQKHGKLTNRIVLDEARDPEHVLHGRYFGMADEVAAEKYRLHLVGEDIRSIKMVYTKPGTDHLQRVREYVIVRSEEGQQYKHVEEVKDDPFLKKLVLADMQREWRTFKQRYDQYEEFFEMVRRDIDGEAA